MRIKINLNKDWLFEKEGIQTNVDLPHTWNAIDGQTGPEMYYRGKCKYQKKFKKPKLDDNQQLYVEFNGVNSSAKVILNKKELFIHHGGYSTFRVNLTNFLQETNVLEVIVDNLPNDYVYPQRADFTFYGGIYRDVNLILVNENHFDLDYFGGKGFFITPVIEGNTAVVKFETYSVGKADQIKVKVLGVGNIDLNLEKRDNIVYGVGSIKIENVHLWDGIDNPYLYQSEAILYKDSVICDNISANFGCRHYHFDSEKGFFLNGRSYQLRGVSRHQDRFNVGNALTQQMHQEDMELILSMGANSIRLAHYQHDQYFYDLCDEKGIIVWAEIPYITIHMDKGRENTITQMKELIVQNYNHPSIICWGLSNEITLQGVTEDLLENHYVLNDLVHKMDSTRVSAMANLFMLEPSSELVSLPDICGYNLYYGWYVGDMKDNADFFDKFHENYPNIKIGLTEYGADSSIYLQSPKPEKGDYTEGYQAVYHEYMLEMISKRPYLWGTYVWNMFEFAAAGRNEAKDPGKNHKGLITFDRKIKKDAFYIYKAYWSKEKFIHLCGKRYRERIEPVTEIKVYSNNEKVSLYVDGVFYEEKKGRYVFKFNVPIKGKHQIKAMSGNLEDTIEIEKVENLNPNYFISSEHIKNWFDESNDQEKIEDGFLSINSTILEIEKTVKGKVFVGKLMKEMSENVAGGMGKGAEIPEAMKAIIARQPLSKLIQQSGANFTQQQMEEIDEFLRQIPKNKENI